MHGCAVTAQRARSFVVLGIQRLFVAWLAGVQPIVILAHGLEFMPAKASWRRKLWKTLLRNVCESAQLVVSNSEYTRRLVLRGAPQS